MKNHLSWRRTLIAVLLAAAVVVAYAATFAPTEAKALSPVRACPAIYPRPAYCDEKRSNLASVNHVGWAYLDLNYCPPGRACAAIFRMNTLAWQWTGSAWQQSSLNNGWVYLSPFDGEWRWAWTQSTGWLALNGGRLTLSAP